MGEGGRLGRERPDGAGVGAGGRPAFPGAVLLGVFAAFDVGYAASVGPAGGFAEQSLGETFSLPSACRNTRHLAPASTKRCSHRRSVSSVPSLYASRIASAS